jgi:hypothetical protein
MTFWDRFVLRLYASMAATLPVGHDALGRLFALAFQRSRLVPTALNDVSVLLVLAASRPGAPEAVAAEYEVHPPPLLQRRAGQGQAAFPPVRFASFERSQQKRVFPSA